MSFEYCYELSTSLYETLLVRGSHVSRDFGICESSIGAISRRRTSSFIASMVCSYEVP